jgi:hypothetical protein
MGSREAASRKRAMPFELPAPMIGAASERARSTIRCGDVPAVVLPVSGIFHALIAASPAQE